MQFCHICSYKYFPTNQKHIINRSTNQYLVYVSFIKQLFKLTNDIHNRLYLFNNCLESPPIITNFQNCCDWGVVC